MTGTRVMRVRMSGMLRPFGRGSDPSRRRHESVGFWPQSFWRQDRRVLAPKLDGELLAVRLRWFAELLAVRLRGSGVVAPTEVRLPLSRTWCPDSLLAPYAFFSSPAGFVRLYKAKRRFCKTDRRAVDERDARLARAARAARPDTDPLTPFHPWRRARTRIP